MKRNKIEKVLEFYYKYLSYREFKIDDIYDNVKCNYITIKFNRLLFKDIKLLVEFCNNNELMFFIRDNEIIIHD